MASFIVTADDLEWFARCRRAWDFGALVRRGLVADESSDRDALVERAVRGALSVHYFPGMWSWNRAIVEPLVLTAFSRDGGGDDSGRNAIAAFLEWAHGVDGFTPLRVETDVHVHVPDPGSPNLDLTSPVGTPVHYSDRIALVVVDDDGRYWTGAHRVVSRFADADELSLDERATLACWAWEQVELGMTVAGTVYTELRLDPPQFRRTVVPRTALEKLGAARRLSAAVGAMLQVGVAIEPSSAWSHCSRCNFRAPCIAMNRGTDPGPYLASYRTRPADVLEEGRLGGVSWGMGRGAAPPRYGRRGGED